MIVWERLRVFAAVAEHGSVSGAAAALHITGPAVTQHVRKLERETHSRLVEPDGRGIRLTAAGHVLASSAHRVAAVVAEAERDLSTVHGQVVGPLRIGSVASALRALLPDALRTLTDQHPRLVPTVRDGEVVDLLPQLRARNLDAVLLESWTHQPAGIPAGVRVRTLAREDVLLAVPSGTAAEGRTVSLAEFADRVWASCPSGTEAQEGLVQVLRAHGVDPDVRYLAGDFSTQLRLVAAGMAVSLVPRIALDPVPEGVTLLPCDPPIGRTLALAVREQDRTPALEALYDALTTAVERTGLGRADDVTSTARSGVAAGSPRTGRR